MALLSVNSKMGRSSAKVFNFALPAFQTRDGFKTCPNAKLCVSGCYARQGAYIWNNVSNKHHENFYATQSSSFVADMCTEIESKLSKGEQVFIRIHDSGDFYNKTYARRWFKVMRHFYQRPVKFYAYTKQVLMFKDLFSEIPSNFNLILSKGGKQDDMIPDWMAHSMVFETAEDLLNAGYHDCSYDDLEIFKTKRVGLVYHGNKGFSKTTWNKVLSEVQS